MINDTLCIQKEVAGKTIPHRVHEFCEIIHADVNIVRYDIQGHSFRVCMPVFALNRSVSTRLIGT